MAKGLGKLLHRITIEAPAESSDGQGGGLQTWATFATVWAEVKPASAFERFNSQRVEADVTHKIRVRYNKDITAAMRISFDNRKFQIKGVRPDDDYRKDYMFLDCEEGVGS